MIQVWTENATLRVIGATILTSFLAAPATADGINPAARAVGAERQRAAAGWLRLESEQRASRARAAPLAPSGSQTLQILEQQERTRYREHLQTRESELGILNRQERNLGSRAPEALQPLGRLRGRLIEQGRTQSGLELRRQMDRRSQGAPLP